MSKENQTDNTQRVVVTGIGMVTPLGIGKEEFGRRLFSGETAIAEIKSFDTSTFDSHLGEKHPANGQNLPNDGGLRAFGSGRRGR
jgi:3-oxoacyl-(acyl-carrier-protein) synthase